MFGGIFEKAVVYWLKRRGYRHYAAHLVARKVREDVGLSKMLGYRTMVSAWSTGFTGVFFHKLIDAGINPQECMPDIHYWKMHPINGSFSHWIDDKLTLKYLLTKHDQYLPRYYFYCKRASVIPLMDCPKGLPDGADGVIQLLRDKEHLALKKNAGSLSIGFYRLDAIGGRFEVNGKEMSEQQLKDFVVALDNYLVTEYVHAHPMLKQFYDKSPNIVRLIVVNPGGRNPEVAAAYLRIGQNRTGFVELSSSGGLFAGVDLESGRIFKPRLFDGPRVQEVVEHPDTGAVLEGLIPHWAFAVQTILQISRYVPNLCYLGWDLIITEDGFRIIEINSLPGISYIQLYHPLLRSEAAAELFGRKNRQRSHVDATPMNQ